MNCVTLDRLRTLVGHAEVRHASCSGQLVTGPLIPRLTAALSGTLPA